MDSSRSQPQATEATPSDQGVSGNTRARFEQWAQNPTCQANTISAVHNVRMADVAAHEGYKPTFGQSPFALSRGQAFERDILRNKAERLITELVRHGVLPEGSSGLADFRLAMNGGPIPSMEAAIEATHHLMNGLATGGIADPPAVVASATVRIPRGVMLPEAILMIDALAVRIDDDRPTLIVGEVKTYPDRGGHTSAQSLAVARAQAGLYVHALEVLMGEFGLTDQIAVSTSGFLVLSKPGSNFPSVRAQEDLRFQAERARRGFDLLEKAALGLPPFDPIVGDLVNAVSHADIHYSEACLTFCDRARKCFEDASAAGDPAVLGDDVRRFLGDIDLSRTLALLEGAAPETVAEEDLMRRITDVEGRTSV